MLRVLQELFAFMMVVGGVLAVAGLVLLVGLTVTLQPFPMDVWRAVVNAVVLFASGLAGSLLVGRVRLNYTTMN